jgi:hypothetical protein
MPTSNIVIGQLYKHDDSGIIMKLESASIPDQDIQLTEPSCYAKRNRFVTSWRGELSLFKAEWSDLDEPELDFRIKPRIITEHKLNNVCLLN